MGYHGILWAVNFTHVKRPFNPQKVFLPQNYYFQDFRFEQAQAATFSKLNELRGNAFKLERLETMLESL